MAKKKKESNQSSPPPAYSAATQVPLATVSPRTDPAQEALAKLPPDVQEKLKDIKEKLDKFQKKVLEKFDKYIVGIALTPPPQPPQPTLAQSMPPQPQGQAVQQPTGLALPGTPAPNAGAQQPVNKDQINVLVVVDDSDSQKMSKQELKDKLSKIIASIGTEIDKNIVASTIILSEVWQGCYDGKSELLQVIALSAFVYDKGMLSAIKIAEIHKSMVLKKFEKYIISYVLAGSLTQGRATPTSDIDVWIVIDDTDVKKMTRVELKDKLRAIIIGMGIEAGEITRIKNKLNIQVYILTEFWDSLREANPVIFTLLRDGVPFYDRGIFMPWKQLLKMGKIKPSPEAIDIFLGSGEQMIRRAKTKINEIGMEDVYYALLSPSQAALMLYGVAPPTPKETAELMREIFARKENLLEEKFVEILEKTIAVRKDIEHGEKKELTGKELDELMTNADKYLKRIKRLFGQIEKIREQKDIVTIYDTAAGMIRDILRLEGVENVKDTELAKTVQEKLVATGKVPSKIIEILDKIITTKTAYDDKTLSKFDMVAFQKDAQGFIRFALEYIQRKRGRELERAKIRVKYGQKFGEVMLLDTHAFIVHDVDVKDKEISKALLNEDGGLGQLDKSSPEELEKAITAAKIPKRAFVKEPIFADLKKIFGPQVEVLIHY